MEEQNYFRTRVNTKQTAKGEWYVDFTSEEGDSNGIPADARAKRHLVYLNAIMQSMENEGKKLVGRE